jgi:hypothetical protein
MTPQKLLLHLYINCINLKEAIMANDKLDDKKIKMLVRAYIEYKHAEAAFKKLKDQYVEELLPGKYESEYGNVLKSVFLRKKFDMETLLKDHPKIKPELYTSMQEVTTTTIQPLMK